MATYTNTEHRTLPRGDARTCPSSRSGQGNADKGSERDPLLFKRPDAKSRGLLFGSFQNGTHQVLDAIILEQKEERNDRNHVAKDTNEEDLPNGEAHPDTDGNGTTEFDDRHGGNGTQDGPFGQTKLHEEVGNLLTCMQMFRRIPDSLFGSQGRSGIKKRQRDKGGCRPADQNAS